MSNRIGIAALVLWLATIAGLGFVFVHGSTAPAPDGRKAVLMSAAERDFVLAEMRGLLVVVRDITAALAENDGAKAGRAAGLMGVEGSHDRAPALLAKLPLDFKRQAMELHGGFDDFAAAAARGEDVPNLHRRLIGQLDRCTACHAGFRIDATP
ncbi:MAG: hypothetical protein HY055_08885 [Magnetospirillum sp.]|nr:hypothetical protein [Magnetospirillum sp.]